MILSSVVLNTVVSLILQDSFYHNLTEEELSRVHEYNFDHPGMYNSLFSTKPLVFVLNQSRTSVSFQQIARSLLLVSNYIGGQFNSI